MAPTVDHGMAVCTYDGEMRELRARRLFPISEREQVVNMGVLPPEFSVELEKVKTTARDFANESARTGGECLLDLPRAQHLLAMPMQDKPLTLCAFKERNFLV